MNDQTTQGLAACIQQLSRILKDLSSPNPSLRERAIGACWDCAPFVGTALVGLVSGLNDSEEAVRIGAIKGLSRAFPAAEERIARFWPAVESDDTEVRLAAIGQVIRILAESLATDFGTTPGRSAVDSDQPASLMEDIMEHAGRWVAWTRDRQHVVAVADSFADVMDQAIKSGETDPYVNKVPGISAEAARKPVVGPLEDESANILDDVSKLVPNSETWLDTPNASLGGEKPRDLVNTGREFELRYLLRGIIAGIPT